jgi:hypothetical protein
VRHPAGPASHYGGLIVARQCLMGHRSAAAIVDTTRLAPLLASAVLPARVDLARRCASAERTRSSIRYFAISPVSICIASCVWLLPSGLRLWGGLEGFGDRCHRPPVPSVTFGTPLLKGTTFCHAPAVGTKMARP